MNAEMKHILFGIGFAAMMVWAVVATAQDKPADNMQLVIEKVRADKKLLVAENMQLTEKEAEGFWPVYEQYQNELFLVRAHTAKLINDFRDAYKTMTDDSAGQLLDDYITIEKLTLRLRRMYLPKFRKALPEIKVLRYYQIENKIQIALMYEIASQIPLMKID
ncbi:MAG: hypothetical protein MRJ65_00085 [Candidatus Brocadiaceae bacterium]|nr:hypothetical protein [Candidatus Brocadiaceae bacterium]